MKTVTLWGRLCEFSNKNNKKLPSLEDKRQLGIKVLQVWFAQEKRPHIYKRKTREGKFINMVWCYPESFAPVIDKIIEEYYKLNNHDHTRRTNQRTISTHS